MKTSHKIILAVAKTMLIFSMGIFVMSLIFLAIVGKPEQTKTWVRDSGLYDSVAQTFRKQLIQDNADIIGSNTTLVENAINKSITGAQVQKFIEQGIDSTYSWLDGSAQEPTFQINTDEIKQTFADNVVASLKARAAKLPACTYNNPPKTNDITTINCIPPGTDIDAELAKVRQQIMAADTSQLSNQAGSSTQTGNNTPAGSPFAGLSSLRTYYQWIKLFPAISGALFLLAAGLIIAFSRPRIRALLTLGIALLPYAVLYFISGLLLPRGIKSSFDAMIKQGTPDDDILLPLQKIAGEIANITGTYMLWIGGVLLLVGVALLIAYKLLKKPDPAQPKDNNAAKQPESQQL